jgi:hypothetical protein
VFLRIVESGLQHDDTRFAEGTFTFLQVCRHWNEVAVGSSQLWVRWTPGAVKAWPLFNSRSKGAPLFLTWRPQLHNAGRDTLADPTVPRRIRQLDFSGDSSQFEHLMSAFDSSPALHASSIRLHITPYGAQKQATSLLSLPFPKLSKLDIEDFLPDSSSPIFITSNLTSLKLRFPYGDMPRYTLARLSWILQKHPGLRRLDLENGAAPLVESLEVPVPFILPQLVNLRLCGVEATIVGLIDLVGMPSPLHNVVIHFLCSSEQTVPVLASIVGEIVMAYYGCQGLDYPRKASHLTVSSDPWGSALVFNVEHHSTSPSRPTSQLMLQFNRTDDELAEKTSLLFPLIHVREFTAVGLNLPTARWCRILQEMEGLLHLRLDHLDIGPVLGALNFDDQGVHNEATGVTSNHSHARR